jgi:hypothetical protein
MARPLPLLDVFLELRRRDFPLGIGDYVSALRALDAGLGLGGPADWRGELLFLCQTLWAKSLEEREQVRDAVESTLPRRATEEEVRLAERGPRVEPATPAVTQPLATSRPPAPAPTPPAERAPAATPAPAAGTTTLVRERVLQVLAVPDRAPVTWQLGVRFDLAGGPPVPRRQMSRAWRHYRRMARGGPPTEFDAAATLAKLAREGVLASPVFVPRRSNRARALLLADVDGSMQPFRYVTRALVESAQQSGLSRIDVRWFHDSPFDTVYREARCITPQRLGEAAAPFVDAGIMIWSDAGAARGALDEARVADSCHMIEVLRSITPAIAWLNPVPAGRWAGSTAQAIREQSGIAMFALDRRGLEDAIDTMRGMVR